MSSSAGSTIPSGLTIPEGSPDTKYFGPYGCGELSTKEGNSQWKQALNSSTDFVNDINKSVKSNFESGSSWYSGSGASRYMVIDLGKMRHFNELRVFQMFNHGKVTSIQMYSHPNTKMAPTYFDSNWKELFVETNIEEGLKKLDTVSMPTVIPFKYTDSRFILIEAKNNGKLGNGNYTEIRELKLFNSNNEFPISSKNSKTKQDLNSDMIVNQK